MPPEEVNHRDHQADEADDSQVDHKIPEGQVGVGADEDVGRVADEGGGAADVGGEGLRHHEGQGIDLEGHGDLDGHRDHQQHGGDVVQKGRDHCRDDHQNTGQDKDISPGQGISLVGQPLEHAGLLHDPHDDHHGQEQEDDVHVDGRHGVFEGDNEIAFIKSPEGIGNKQNQGRAQQRRQGAVHPFEGDDEVDQQQDNGGNPEGRGDLALDMEILLDLEELVAGSIRSRHDYRHDRGRQGHPGRFKGLDLHFSIRQGPRR